MLFHDAVGSAADWNEDCNMYILQVAALVAASMQIIMPQSGTGSGDVIQPTPATRSASISTAVKFQMTREKIASSKRVPVLTLL